MLLYASMNIWILHYIYRSKRRRRSKKNKPEKIRNKFKAVYLCKRRKKHKFKFFCNNAYTCLFVCFCRYFSIINMNYALVYKHKEITLSLRLKLKSVELIAI